MVEAWRKLKGKTVFSARICNVSVTGQQDELLKDCAFARVVLVVVPKN
jgi:hypothetical protein